VSSPPQVNVCKKKALTNMRAAGKDGITMISEPIPVTLDYALEVRAANSCSRQAHEAH
jgi:predicted membrane GTPase involved in stress response